MKPEKHKMIFGRRVRNYEPDNLKSPRGFNEADRFGHPKRGVTSLLSSSETHQKKVPRNMAKGLTSKRRTFQRKLPSKWRVRRFTERSNTTINKSISSKNEYMQSMETETKTKKRSLWKHSQTTIPPSLTISDIIQPKPVEKHQMWISSLTRNRKNSRVEGLDPYLNMSSFNISDDISHIIPSFSSKARGKEFQRFRGESSNRESVISQSNFLKNNQSISAIEPDNHSYRFIHKDDPSSFLGEMAPEIDLQINLYDHSTDKTMSKQHPGQTEKITPRFNSSCNTLQYSSNEFTKRVMNHKKNNPSLDVTQANKFCQSGGLLPKSRHFSQPNNALPGRKLMKFNIRRVPGTKH